jgi:hypothetical protein
MTLLLPSSKLSDPPEIDHASSASSTNSSSISESSWITCSSSSEAPAPLHALLLRIQRSDPKDQDEIDKIVAQLQKALHDKDYETVLGRCEARFNLRRHSDIDIDPFLSAQINLYYALTPVEGRRDPYNRSTGDDW